MKNLFFKILGAAHACAGLMALFAVSVMTYGHGFASLYHEYNIVETIGGVLMTLCLIACGLATWLRPNVAPLFAWLSAAAYVIAPLLQHFLNFGNVALGDLLHSFWYSSAIRLAAALLLTVLGAHFGDRANYSFKPNTLRSSKRS